jgi:hypothetical protein
LFFALLTALLPRRAVLRNARFERRVTNKLAL